MGTKLVVMLLFQLNYMLCLGNKEYILKTEECKIPEIEPINEDVSSLVKSQEYFTCNETELLTSIEKIGNKSAKLKLRRELIPEYTSKKIKCFYSYVNRSPKFFLSDEGIRFSQWREVQKSVSLTQDTVKVKCNEVGSDNLIYENVHTTVLVKPSIEEKLNTFTNSTKPFGVLIIAIDSFSRLNFIRTMSQTYKYLKDNDFIELKGYTKVEDNTFPNCMAFLTGFNLREANVICKPHTVDGLTNCPMIWYDYRKLGYITAYAEDDSAIATFNNNKKGFSSSPTDYYFKAYIEASETLKITYYKQMPFCTGPEISSGRILNLAKDFSVTFKNHPIFGIFWMNTFSHKVINLVMDENIKSFFQDLQAEGVFENNIIIFLSDHGIKFGDIPKTKTGWFEERMPVNMIRLPQRFRNMFENEYNNLKNNANKLISTYDMFATLQHILSLSGLSYNRKPISACPKCYSVFDDIPFERSCKDAGIPGMWCTCGGHFQYLDRNSVFVQKAIRIGLIKININRSKFGQLVVLKEVLLASMSEDFVYDGKETILFVVFETTSEDTILMTVEFKNTINIESKFHFMKNRKLY